MRGRRVLGLIFGLSYTVLYNGAFELDPNFKPQFEPYTGIHDLVVRPTGEIVVAVFKGSSNSAGTTNSIVQLKSNGAVDGTFQTDVLPGHLRLLPDGKLLVNGSRNGTTKLFRLLPNGSVDPTFNSPEIAPYDFTVDPHGRIYIVGDFFRTLTNNIQRLYLHRLHPDGQYDESFVAATAPHYSRESGLVTVTVQPDGKPILAGVFNSPAGKNHFARFLEDGSDDPTFSNLNPMSSSFCYQLKVLPDGSILHASRTLLDREYALLQRFFPDRTRDPHFAHDERMEGHLSRFDVQKDGKIIAAILSNRHDQRQLVRFQQNGKLDKSFGSSQARFLIRRDPISFGALRRIAIEPDGDILVGGEFTSYNGQPVTNLVRIIGERAYITSIEPKKDSLQVSWLLTEPEKAYSPQTSTDLLTWTDHNDFTRSGDRLTVTMPATSNQRFIRAIQN